MDTIIPLLVMAIFYLGPALLKKYRAQQPIPPTAPKPLPVESKMLPPNNKAVSVHIGSDSREKSTMPVERVNPSPKMEERKSEWDGKLDHNVIANGIIFAEILQPPRAYRPFRPK